MASAKVITLVFCSETRRNKSIATRARGKWFNFEDNETLHFTDTHACASYLHLAQVTSWRGKKWFFKNDFFAIWTGKCGIHMWEKHFFFLLRPTDLLSCWLKVEIFFPPAVLTFGHVVGDLCSTIASKLDKFIQRRKSICIEKMFSHLIYDFYV